MNAESPTKSKFLKVIIRDHVNRTIIEFQARTSRSNSSDCSNRAVHEAIIYRLSEIIFGLVPVSIKDRVFLIIILQPNNFAANS